MSSHRSDDSVGVLAARVWSQREAAQGLRQYEPYQLARDLAVAVVSVMAENDLYDPECDLRVEWLRELIADMRRIPRWKRPKASVDAEFRVMFMLGKLEVEPCRKLAACGD